MLEKGKLPWEVVSVGSFVGLLNPAALGLLVLLGPLPGPALLRPRSSGQEGCPSSQPQRNTPSPPSPTPFHLSLTFLTFHPLLTLTPPHLSPPLHSLPVFTPSASQPPPQAQPLPQPLCFFLCPLLPVESASLWGSGPSGPRL